MRTSIQEKFNQVSSAIKTYGTELARYPGVLAVEPGFAEKDGLITDEPAIVVLVLRKVAMEYIIVDGALPRSVGYVPVDVRQASPAEQIKLFQQSGASDLAAFLKQRADGLGQVDPRTPLEREKGAGDLEAELVDYPKPDFSLEEVDEPMTVVLHASPDNGWDELKRFLQGPVEHLSATIYEFEAQYVKDAIIAACGPDGRMDFVMHYMGKDNVWDGADAAQALKDALGDRLRFAWAPVANFYGATTQGWFPYAYHEKVIVKDHRHFWLSSGNWKNSGQPVEDPFNPPAGFDEAAFLKNKNREWHVIADCPALATQFERFIQHDLETASGVQNPDVALEAELPDVFVPLGIAPETEPEWFSPLTIVNERLRVTPLLSPDNFIEEVTALVKTARRRLYIQNQYVKPSDIQRWKELNEFVRDFSHAEGVDFKLIIRDTSYWESINIMKEYEVDTSTVKVLKGSHTKGIIVDDAAVVVGSHNWSGAGFMDNRDASLIFYDERIISHYERLFNFDYERAFHPRRPAPEADAVLAGANEPAPPGMKRVSWGEYADR